MTFHYVLVTQVFQNSFEIAFDFVFAFVNCHSVETAQNLGIRFVVCLVELHELRVVELFLLLWVSFLVCLGFRLDILVGNETLEHLPHSVSEFVVSDFFEISSAVVLVVVSVVSVIVFAGLVVVSASLVISSYLSTVVGLLFVYLLASLTIIVVVLTTLSVIVVVIVIASTSITSVSVVLVVSVIVLSFSFFFIL